MFELIERNRTASERKAGTVLLSIVLHVVIIGLFIVVPLLYVNQDLPTPHEVIGAFTAAAPVVPKPPPPPPPPAAAAQPKPVATTGQAELAPVAAPSKIEVNPVPPAPPSNGAVGVPGGVVGGIAGGVAGGTVGGIPDAPASAGPVRVGGGIKAPGPTHRVDPEYPPVARASHTQGMVILEATVDTNGQVQNVRVVRGNPLLNQSAIDAVKQWRYSPLVLNGQPTSFILTVEVTFKLQ